MFALKLVRGAETRSFFLDDRAAEGWDLTEEANGQPVRTVSYTDWHRVERAISMILIQADALEREGWRSLAHDRSL